MLQVKKKSERKRRMKQTLSLLMTACMAAAGTAGGFPSGVHAEETERVQAARNAGDVTWVMSQENNYFQNMGTVQTEDWNESDHRDLYIDVDETITYQQMAENVWGGCFSERGWHKLMQLTEEERNHVLDLLFAPDEPEGLHLTMGRLPIGSNDYAMDMYSLDETEDDYELNDFSIERDKEKLIPFIKAALERQPDLKLWASPWSPPWWMKRNEDGSPRTQKDGGYIDFTEENMSAYGAYFRKFVDAYEAEGIHISMVSPQNEPTMWTGYSSCLWTGEELRDFIRDYLSPALEGTGVEIYLGTFTNSDDNLAFPSLVDPEARKCLSGITFQWWSYNLARSLYHTGFDLDMMQSETMCGDGRNNWQYAENQFDEMWMYFSNGITSYNMWNMVLDWNGTNPGGANTTGGWYQNAPITVNETTKEYSLNPHYYEIRHYSSYVQPGARRIESGGTYDMAYTPSTTSDRESDATYTAARREIAFRNPDGTIALMVKNGEGSAQDVDINFNGRKISVTLPAHSISTFTTQGTPLTGKETDMTETIPKEEIVEIRNVETGKALSVKGGGTASLSDIIQWDYSGQASQQWYLEPSSIGDTPTVKLVNIKSFSIAAVNGGTKNDGERLILWVYEGNADQNWIMEKSGDYYKFKNGNSGMYMTLESTASDARAVQKPASDSNLQLWEVVPAYTGSESSDLLADFNFDDDAGGFVGGKAKAEGTYTLSDEGYDGNSLYLDGSTSNYLSVTKEDGTSLLTGVEELTISYDMKPDRADTNWAFYAAPSDATQVNNREQYLGILIKNGVTTAERYLNSGSRPSVAEATTGDSWYHVDVVVAKENTTVYVNGQERSKIDSSISVPQILGDSSVLYIGKANWGAQGEFFKGWLDNYKIYGHACSKDELPSVSPAFGEVLLNQAEQEIRDVTLSDRSATLPSYYGTVTWKSDLPEVTIAEDGLRATVRQPENGQEPITGTLTAVLTVLGNQREVTVPVTILPEAAADDPYGYLMVHFVEDSNGYAEKIYLDISRGDNPEQWDPLNGRKPILASNLGTTGVRDPYLTYNPETETYYIIATDLRVFGGDNLNWGGWQKNYSTKLNVWESKDLITWTDFRQFDVVLDEQGHKLANLGMLWAPEATWVPDYYGDGRGAFVVYWSSTVYEDEAQNNSIGSHIMWGATTDFTKDTWEYGGKFLDGGSNGSIDTTIIQNAGKTYHITKSNSEQIIMESTDSKQWWLPDTKWTRIQSRIGQSRYGACEGPAVFKDHSQENRWYLFVDDLPVPGYQPMVSTDLDKGWDYLDDPDYFLTENTKHGGVISLTKRQYDAIRAADAVSAVENELGTVTIAKDVSEEGLSGLLPKAEVNLAYDSGTSMLPVRWDLSGVKFGTPGSYPIEGVVQTIGANLDQWVGDGGSTSYLAENKTLYSSGEIRVSATVEITDRASFTPGDVDNDGSIRLSDAVLALEWSVKEPTDEEKQSQPYRAANVDGDENVTTKDVLRILKKANGREVEGL